MRRLVVSAFLILAVTASDVRAQDYPTKPITIVVPTSPGGPPDTLARLLSERMRAVLGQPIVIENVTGAGGTAGVTRAARAAPDGYTLSIGHFNSHVISSISYNVPYDPLKDLEPVAMLVSAPMLFIARQDIPAANLRELVAWLKANPNKATFGSVGVGGPARLWGSQFQQANGAPFQFVPYRGAVLIVQDMLAGHIDLGCMEASNIVPHLRGGKIRVHAVLTKDRWKVAPEIPTIAETGVAGLEMTFWHGMWVPKGTPRDAVTKLNRAVVAALNDPAVRRRLGELGQDVVPASQLTPEALGAHHKAEIDKWSPLVKAAGIKAQ
ncbi:MAG: tripartite tricarboxylate transporter substrate binding protein BugD [Alphaproteobacteria bacterium]|nr:tripartite tricarboxylate transporter substrate binding protein BugD [Alphaproteobacteria bacterium]